MASISISATLSRTTSCLSTASFRSLGNKLSLKVRNDLRLQSLRFASCDLWLVGLAMPVEVQRGYKFAVISVPDSRAGGSPAPLVQLPDGFAVSPDLPPNALDTWQQNIGLFHRQELEECRLFLWSLAPSAHPEVLDNENEELGKRAYC